MKFFALVMALLLTGCGGQNLRMSNVSDSSITSSSGVFQLWQGSRGDTLDFRSLTYSTASSSYYGRTDDRAPMGGANCSCDVYVAPLPDSVTGKIHIQCIAGSLATCPSGNFHYTLSGSQIQICQDGTCRTYF